MGRKFSREEPATDRCVITPRQPEHGDDSRAANPAGDRSFVGEKDRAVPRKKRWVQTRRRTAGGAGDKRKTLASAERSGLRRDLSRSEILVRILLAEQP